MKKIFLTVTMALLSTVVMAQVEFFEKSLKKAIKTAKSEDKIVILLASASW